jgi:hypothetical protein
MAGHVEALIRSFFLETAPEKDVTFKNAYKMDRDTKYPITLCSNVTLDLHNAKLKHKSDGSIPVSSQSYFPAVISSIRDYFADRCDPIFGSVGSIKIVLADTCIRSSWLSGLVDAVDRHSPSVTAKCFESDQKVVAVLFVAKDASGTPILQANQALVPGVGYLDTLPPPYTRSAWEALMGRLYSELKFEFFMKKYYPKVLLEPQDLLLETAEPYYDSRH